MLVKDANGKHLVALIMTDVLYVIHRLYMQGRRSVHYPPSEIYGSYVLTYLWIRIHSVQIRISPWVGPGSSHRGNVLAGCEILTGISVSRKII